MTDPKRMPQDSDGPQRVRQRSKAVRETVARKRHRRSIKILVSVAVAVVAIAGAAAWLAFQALTLKDNLQATTQLLPELKAQILDNNRAGALVTVDSLAGYTAAAKAAGTDPVWKMASSLPWIGPNLAAATEVAVTADDVVSLAAKPLVSAFESLDWNALTPTGGAAPLDGLSSAAPSVVAAANTVQLSYTRLADIDSSRLLPQIAVPLTAARDQLGDLRGTLNIASSAARLVPSMMGEKESRNYLLLIQNSAEIRATGGIPGALAVLNVNKGIIQLTYQDSASAMGAFDPAVKVDPEQESIYTNRLGSYMQNVNMTPDFPTAATTARTMWQQRHPDQPIDGVISLDTIVLSMVLEAAGPIDVSSAVPRGVSVGDLPTRLTSANLVKALLSDVYSDIKNPALQDAYFAEVAKRVFTEISSGNTSGEKLIASLAAGVQDNRIKIWSAHAQEQNLLAAQRIGGSISGPSVAPTAFGVYFNDGTGAKMDYYVQRTVQLVKKCTAGGYGEYTARITLTNTAPLDAARSLPNYVTGGGVFGVKPGHVTTNVIAYGPAQARAQAARMNGENTSLASFSHDERPVGVIRVDLAPGQSTTVEVDFSKVVQTSEAQLDVTPTVQKASDVILPKEEATCAAAAP